MEPTRSPVPKHVAIILDGNRRFAKRLMMKPWKGHEIAAGKLRNMLKWCRDAGVDELTLYAFSIQNFDRPKEEFDYLMKTFCDEAENLLNDEKLMKSGIRIRFIGRTGMFSEQVQSYMKKLQEKTRAGRKYVLNIAMAYGGREEIVDAVQKIAKQVEEGSIRADQIDENTLNHAVYLESKPDLIIRTGGEKRLSNFLSWQNAYSELIFVEKLLPEFEEEDFKECLIEYSKRQRRFGQ
ncbi:MAG: polyprenyl diphosphate synthase [Candidatus Woesearchaeota archaeon]